jgi:hypothetical protein
MKRTVKTVLITLLILAICADWYDGYGNLVYRGLLGRLTDALHAAHGGETHSGIEGGLDVR